MKQVISGAVAVTMTMNSWKQYFPYIAELKNRTVKYIDIFKDAYDMNNTYLNASPYDFNISLVRKGSTDIFIDSLNCSAMDPEIRSGERLFIGEVVDIEKCFVTADGYGIGKSAMFVFYWQDDNVTVDSDTTTAHWCSAPNYAKIVGLKSFFEDSRILADKKFTAISPSWTAKTPDGTTNLMNTYQTQGFINLVKGSNIFVKNVPLWLFQRYTHWREHLEFDNVELDFTNSFIEVPTAVFSSLQGGAYVLDFEYK